MKSEYHAKSYSQIINEIFNEIQRGKSPEALNFSWSCIPGSRWAEVRLDSSRQYNEDLFAFLRWVGRPAGGVLEQGLVRGKKYIHFQK